MGPEAKQQLLTAISAEIESRLTSIWQQDFAALKAQEFAVSEEDQILGNKVTFTAFREELPSGCSIVMVQATIPAFFGLGWRSAEAGLVIEPGGNVRRATEKELRYVL